MRYQGIEPELSAMITQADPRVQRRLAIAFAELIAERFSLPRTNEVLTAITGGTLGDSELRQWVHERAHQADQRALALENAIDAAEVTGQSSPHEHELNSVYTTKGVYRVMDAALDDDPHRAAQETAYLSHLVLSDREPETLVGFILREAGFDVSAHVYWLDDA